MQKRLWKWTKYSKTKKICKSRYFAKGLIRQNCATVSHQSYILHFPQMWLACWPHTFNWLALYHLIGQSEWTSQTLQYNHHSNDKNVLKTEISYKIIKWRISEFFTSFLSFLRPSEREYSWFIGNRTSCRPILSVIILLINKSDSHFEKYYWYGC